MAQVHGYIAVGVLGLNLLAGVWGGFAWLRRRPTVFFWYALRTAQLFVVVQVILGGILLLTDHKVRDDLHLLYGLLPLVVMLVTESMRVGVAAREVGDKDIHELERSEQQAVALRIVRRETGIMALGALIIFALALRAAMTAGYF